MRILVTGQRGYLMGHLLPHLEGNIIYFEGDVGKKSNFKYKVDVVIHFASPSDSNDFKDVDRMADTIITGTRNMLDIARENNAFFIYASSQAAMYGENSYGVFKLAAEHIIKDTYDSYSILRIPRVYSADKNKGLIKNLKDNQVPVDVMDLCIEYIDIQEFLDYTLKRMFRPGLNNYKSCEYISESMNDIGERYNL